MADASSMRTSQVEQHHNVPLGSIAQSAPREMEIRIDRKITSPFPDPLTPFPHGAVQDTPAVAAGKPLTEKCFVRIVYTPQQQGDSLLIQRAETGAHEIEEFIGTLLPSMTFWAARVVHTDLEASRAAMQDTATTASRQMSISTRIESASYFAWLGVTGASTRSSWLFPNIAGALGSAMVAFCWPSGNVGHNASESLRIATGIAAATTKLACAIGGLADNRSLDDASTVQKYLMPALMIGNAVSALVAYGRAAYHHKQFVDLDRHLAKANSFMNKMSFVHHGLRFYLDEINGRQLTYRVEEA